MLPKAYCKTISTLMLFHSNPWLICMREMHEYSIIYMSRMCERYIYYCEIGICGHSLWVWGKLNALPVIKITGKLFYWKYSGIVLRITGYNVNLVKKNNWCSFSSNCFIYFCAQCYHGKYHEEFNLYYLHAPFRFC